MENNRYIKLDVTGIVTVGRFIIFLLLLRLLSIYFSLIDLDCT